MRMDIDSISVRFGAGLCDRPDSNIQTSQVCLLQNPENNLRACIRSLLPSVMLCHVVSRAVDVTMKKVFGLTSSAADDETFQEAPHCTATSALLQWQDMAGLVHFKRF